MRGRAAGVDRGEEWSHVESGKSFLAEGAALRAWEEPACQEALVRGRVPRGSERRLKRKLGPASQEAGTYQLLTAVC